MIGNIAQKKNRVLSPNVEKLTSDDLIFDLRTSPASLDPLIRRPDAIQAELKCYQYVDAPFENLKVSVDLP